MKERKWTLSHQEYRMKDHKKEESREEAEKNRNDQKRFSS